MTPDLAHFGPDDLPDLSGKRAVVTGANSGSASTPRRRSPSTAPRWSSPAATSTRPGPPP